MFPVRYSLHTHARCWIGRRRPILMFALVTLGVVLVPSIALAQQLNLNWVDSADGQASFIIQRAVGATGTYTQIAQVPVGVVSYTDATVSLGTTYCYQVAAVNSSGVSAFSNVACGSPTGGFTLTAAKAGSGMGTVASNPAGINCGSACSYTYLSGKAVTLTATPASGSTFSGWTGGGCSGPDPCTLAGNGSVTVTATFAMTVNSTPPNQGTPRVSAPVTLTLAYNGKLRDRVGQGNTALGHDGALDGTLTATLRASGGRTVTGLRLDSTASGVWDTSSATGYWVLAVAPTVDRAVLNMSRTMAVNFPVADGGSFVVFASDHQGRQFLPGRTVTLTVTFADGSSAKASTTVR